MKWRATLYRDRVCSSYDGVSVKDTEYVDVVIEFPPEFIPAKDEVYTFYGGWKLGKHDILAEPMTEDVAF